MFGLKVRRFNWEVYYYTAEGRFFVSASETHHEAATYKKKLERLDPNGVYRVEERVR